MIIRVGDTVKKILLSLLLLLILSGCSYSTPNITRIDNLNYEQMMYMILPLKIRMHNVVGNGYKYYAPKGVARINSKNNNEVLKHNNNKYYLYVDIINYYYKNDVSFQKNASAYYSDKIKFNGKDGYIQIIPKGNKMYVDMVYNYARIETYVDKKDLKDTIASMSFILTSVEFNDTLLTKMYEQGTLGSKEEVYKLFDNKEREGNFIEYIEEYDKYNNDNNTKTE